MAHDVVKGEGQPQPYASYGAPTWKLNVAATNKGKNQRGIRKYLENAVSDRVKPWRM
jgi:hypothetical protein